MPLTPEQSKKIKKQLLEQVASFPDDKRDSAEEYIENMDDAQLEEFLIQNNLIKPDGEGNTPTNYTPEKCIFCSILKGEIPSTKIDENDDAIAILEINPISKAHALIIPKIHINSEEELKEGHKALAKRIYKKLLVAFKPKSVITANANILGHEVINVIPVYENETLNSKRTRSTPEALAILAQKISKLKVKKKKAIPKKETPEEKNERIINEENTWLPVRIP
jgi:histidine triad (HIT) family protein